MRINKSLITYQPASGAGSGTVTSVGLSAPTGFSVSGSPVVSSGTLALAFTTGYGIPPLMTGNSGRFLTTNGTTMSWVNITGTDVTGAALTETDDTNVTMTLGGSPSTALLRSVSMTLGWAGQLAVSRGGTGANSLQGVLIGNLTAPVTAVTGIGGQLLRANPSTGVYEFFTPSYMSNPMTTLGDIIYGNAAGAPTRLAANGTANNMYLRSVSGGIPSWASIAGGDITGAALTEVDDTNVTCTLGGTPANALLRSVSLTFGWTGQLSVPRGGTGVATLTGVVIGNGTGVMTGVAGTAEQLLRRNTANTAYEFFTPTYLSNPMTSLGDIIYGNAAGAPLRLGANATSTNKFLRSVNGAAPTWEEVTGFLTGSGTTNYIAKWTPSGSALGNSQIFDNGTNIGIGDASPSVLIDAYKASNGIIRVRADNGGAFYVANSTKTGTIAAFGDAGGIIGGAADTTAMVYSGGVPMAFYVNSFERARITTSGLFGIGTNAPSYNLDVSGTARFTGNVLASNVIRLIGDENNSAKIKAGKFLSIADDGNIVGINYNSDSILYSGYILHVNGNTYNHGSLALRSTYNLTWGGEYGAGIPTITGTSGTGAFLSFYPSGSSSGEKMKISDNGQIRFNGYTSTSSFIGLTVGLLGFTSTGAITTYSIPGGVSGTQDYLAKFDSTGVAVANSRIVDNGTNFLLNSASSYVTGLNLIGDIGMQSASGQASAIIMRSNQTPTNGTSIGIIDSYGITTGSTYQRGGGIEFVASQDWNSTSAGTNIFIQTAPDNTIAPADMFVFLSNGAVRFIGRTSNPIGAAAGTMYYNSSANNMRYYNGTSWIIF